MIDGDRHHFLGSECSGLRWLNRLIFGTVEANWGRRTVDEVEADDLSVWKSRSRYNTRRMAYDNHFTISVMI